MNVNFKSLNSNADPYFNNVSLLLHMNGVSGSKNFVDSSLNNIQSTAVGNIELSTSTKKFGSASARLYGDGGGNYLNISGNQNLAMGTGDYTIEMWAYTNNDNYTPIYESAPPGSSNLRTNSFIFYLENSRRPRFLGGDAGNSIDNPTNTFPINTWAHLALVRHTGTTTIYVNGSIQGQATFFYNDTLATGGCLIGTFIDDLNFVNNIFIDEFRITKGVARYTGNFTPPTSEFLDTPPRKSLRFGKSNDGKKTLLRPINLPILEEEFPNGALVFWKLDNLTDSSTNANTLTNNGSVQFVSGKIGNCAQFDGSAKSLNINSFTNSFSAAVPYTISLWYNITMLKNYFSLIGCINIGTLNIHGFANGDLAINNSESEDISVSNFFTTGSWNHFVVTRNSSNQIAVWKNGIKVHESTSTTTYSNVPFINIGNLNTNGTSFATNGKIDAVGIWQRELTEIEIQKLYNNNNGLEL
jgi:hypothetical protein